MASTFKRGGKNNRSGYWYIQYYDHTGHRRTKCSKTTVKSAAERIAAKIEADEALLREGVIDPGEQSYREESQKFVEEHLEVYETKLIYLYFIEHSNSGSLEYVSIIIEKYFNISIICSQ